MSTVRVRNVLLCSRLVCLRFVFVIPSFVCEMYGLFTIGVSMVGVCVHGVCVCVTLLLVDNCCAVFIMGLSSRCALTLCPYVPFMSAVSVIVTIYASTILCANIYDGVMTTRVPVCHVLCP